MAATSGAKKMRSEVRVTWLWQQLWLHGTSEVWCCCCYSGTARW